MCLLYILIVILIDMAKVSDTKDNSVSLTRREFECMMLYYRERHTMKGFVHTKENTSTFATAAAPVLLHVDRTCINCGAPVHVDQTSTRVNPPLPKYYSLWPCTITAHTLSIFPLLCSATCVSKWTIVHQFCCKPSRAYVMKHNMVTSTTSKLWFTPVLHYLLQTNRINIKRFNTATNTRYLSFDI